MSTVPEPWLRGPIAGVDPYLMPAAHALTQSSEDIARAAGDLSPAALWARPGGAASVGFHLRHIAGSIGRLLTYARGERLSAAQLAAISAEGVPGEPPEEAAPLVQRAQEAIAGAIDALRATPREVLLEPRTVGRAALPTNVLGLLMHVAEHTQRHTGQIIATAKVVQGS
ncbi:MAG: DinB family protein [Gemmatimonadaceae bacterium]|nr:DinB family protein [Gemmatimonadaceae bacterium]